MQLPSWFLTGFVAVSALESRVPFQVGSAAAFHVADDGRVLLSGHVVLVDLSLLSLQLGVDRSIQFVGDLLALS